MNIDVHAHVIPRAYLELVRRGDLPGVRLEQGGGVETITVTGGAASGPIAQRLTVVPGYHDSGARLKTMDAASVDVHVLSPMQFLFHYWLDIARAVELARLVNDGIAEMVRERRDRFVGMAAVPLQDPGAAVCELDRIQRDLGMRAVEIGTHIAGTPLDAPGLDPFWARAEALGILVFVHPYAPLGADRLGAYFLRNILGNPFETALALSHLLFGGVAERFPGLRLCFAHGGGAMPYVIGRLERGFDVSPDCRLRTGERPAAALRRFYYDTIVHDGAALEYLIARVGASQVLMGSDYPFDIGDPDPVRTVERLGIPRAARQAICGATAAALFGL
jgi:aminocarboxymuconate-semialdehyde decarboxylase